MVEQEQQDDLVDYISDEENKDIEKDQKGNSYQPGNEINQPSYAGIHATGFKDFLLKNELNRAIADCGFEHPSEVQQEAIPNAILGNDMLVQAKSGMGKTAVFVLAILHQMPSKDPDPISALVLCHTRELAFQNQKEFERLGKYLKDTIRTNVFYGGENIENQKKLLKSHPPHILVGTPGRILDLANKGYLNFSQLKYFVLDECDKMLEQLDMRSDVQQIFKKTPQDKQVMFFSATLNHEIRKVCRKFMQKQVEIFINDDKLTLDGLQQYYVNIEEHEKNKKLTDLLDALLFNQVIIFVKSVERAIALNRILQECNFPSIDIHSKIPQEERIARYEQFKKFKKRIMVATDIFGRGIDVERVNIVFNYDMPTDSDSYLHRVGRAGRFGTKGLTVTFVTNSDERKILDDIQDRFVVKVNELPEEIDTSLYMNS